MSSSSSTLTKVARVSGIALLTISTIPAITNQPSYANSTTFFCANSKGSPTTFVKTDNGRKIPMIRWISNNYFSSNLSPTQRCREVSNRFQRSYDNGTLRTIISGTLNKQPVVCAAGSTYDTCNENNLLFTLKRGTNAKQAVESLLDRRGLAAGRILNQNSNNTQIYVDFDTYINSIKPE
ncbi:MAG: COP23 domain-containing protein [Nostochopsis sp.]